MVDDDCHGWILGLDNIKFANECVSGGDDAEMAVVIFVVQVG